MPFLYIFYISLYKFKIYINMKKLIDVSDDVIGAIDVMPGTFTFNVNKLIKRGLIPKLPFIYDVQKIDLTKMLFLIIMNDFNYIREKLGENMVYNFSREYVNNTVEISFIVNHEDETITLLNEQTQIKGIFVVFDTEILISAISGRVNFREPSKLRLLTISDKLKLVPDKWKEDQYFMSFIEKNYLNNV